MLRLINVGVVWWIGSFEFVLYGLSLFIGWFNMLKIWLRVGIFIGMVIGVFVFMIFVLCFRLLVDVMEIVWILLFFKSCWIL